MTGKFGRGAFFALLTAAAIAGCSNSKKSSGGIVVGNPGDLNNPDNVPQMSSIATHNLADDTGAFSNNGQQFLNAVMTFNSSVGAVSSGSAASANDGSGIMLFTTNDATGNHGRLYATHYENGTFTPPTEISGDFRDELRGAGDIDLGHAIMIPLNVGSYADPATGQQVSAVSRNKGNWVILWSATTRTLDPQLLLIETPLRASPALEGPRRTIYYTLFLHELRNTSSAVSDVLGKPDASTQAGKVRTYEYGFLKRGVDVIKTKNSTFIGGAVQLDAHDGTNTVVGDLANHFRPAEDVINYGVASDTLVGPASFNSNANEPITNGGHGVDMTNNAIPGVGAKLGTSSPTGTARPVGSAYAVGDATSFLRLFFVQLTSSRNSAGDTYRSPNLAGENQGAHGGGRYRMFSADFDLDAQDFKAAAEVGFPGQRPAPAGPSLSNARTQPSARSLQAYNGHFLWSYLDASLAGDNTALQNEAGLGFGTDVDQLLGVGAQPGQVAMSTRSKIQAVSTVFASGIASSSAPVTRDLTICGTAGVHLIAANTLPGGPDPNGAGTGNTFPASERNTIGPLDEVTSATQGRLGGGIFGTDAGLVDTSSTSSRSATRSRSARPCSRSRRARSSSAPRPFRRRRVTSCRARPVSSRFTTGLRRSVRPRSSTGTAGRAVSEWLLRTR
jgi:hypothetical protein